MGKPMNLKHSPNSSRSSVKRKFKQEADAKLLKLSDVNPALAQAFREADDQIAKVLKTTKKSVVKAAINR